MKHNLGDIWKESGKWKLQAPKGIDTFSTLTDAKRIAIGFIGKYQILNSSGIVLVSRTK